MLTPSLVCCVCCVLRAQADAVDGAPDSGGEAPSFTDSHPYDPLTPTTRSNHAFQSCVATTRSNHALSNVFSDHQSVDAQSRT